MKIPLYQVDAFTSRLFGGNPAAVCPLEAWLDERAMQAIAAENNLAETAFFVGGGGRYEIRWFTPLVEVNLCGHATLASAFVIFRSREPSLEAVSFRSKSGELRVTRSGDRLTLDFPAWAPARRDVSDDLSRALGAAPREVWTSQDTMAVYESEDDVRRLAPAMERVAALDTFAVIATAPGRTVDFVSRFFAPRQGIPEDPATGRAHCTLTPYWPAGWANAPCTGRSSRGEEANYFVRTAATASPYPATPCSSWRERSRSSPPGARRGVPSEPPSLPATSASGPYL